MDFLVELLNLFLKGFHLVLHVLDCVFFASVSLGYSLEVFELVSKLSDLVLVEGGLGSHRLDVVVILLEFSFKCFYELVLVLKFMQNLL